MGAIWGKIIGAKPLCLTKALVKFWQALRFGSKNKTLSEWKEATAEYKSEWTMNNSNLSANVGIGATILGHLQAKVNYNIALGKTGEVKQSGLVNGVVGGVKDAVKGKANAWQISVAYLF